MATETVSWDAAVKNKRAPPPPPKKPSMRSASFSTRRTDSQTNIKSVPHIKSETSAEVDISTIPPFDDKAPIVGTIPPAIKLSRSRAEPSTPLEVDGDNEDNDSESYLEDVIELDRGVRTPYREVDHWELGDIQSSVDFLRTRFEQMEWRLIRRGYLKASELETKELEQRRKHLPTIPKLQYLDWQNFKNKVSSDESSYAIEILRGEAKYYYEREDEERTHRLRTMHVRSGSVAVEDRDGITQLDMGAQKGLPERIRINSRPVLTIMAQIDSEERWTQEPTIVLRPFKPFVYYRSQIHETLAKLEADWDEAEKAATLEGSQDSAAEVVESIERDEEDSAATEKSISSHGESLDPPRSSQPAGDNSVVKTRPPIGDVPLKEGDISAAKASGDGKEDEKKDEPEDLSNSIEALRDLRCLVEFMDKHLDPVVSHYENDDCKKVSFADLWHIFKPQDLIYGALGTRIPTEEATSDEDGMRILSTKALDRYQEVWRVMSTADGRANLRAQRKKDRDPYDDDMYGPPPPRYGREREPFVGRMNVRVNNFTVMCYFVDFNGSTFFPVSSRFSIPPFKGYKDIRSLPFYPLRFAKDRDLLRAKWLARGTAFRTYVMPTHQYYEGKRVTCRPDGYDFPEDKFPFQAGNVDSEVVVDFSESMNFAPEWNLAALPLVTTKNGSSREASEDFPLYYWTDHNRTKLDDKREENIYLDRGIDEAMMESARERDGLARDTPDKNLQDDWNLGDEHLILLPNRVYAFVMAHRQFALITIDGLRAVRTDKNGLNDLILRAGHKDIVASLVSEHFRKKAATRSNLDTSYDSDIVRGKGKGLIILLHGAPGVGKTSTAECIAGHYRKPLFPVTCGDLGLTAADVEDQLKYTFHLAELWDCVLLLDEADVFLAERTRQDIKRNSLVSVFLRVMEYFTGLLFLTTNRVGSFDPAFTSRIHLSLHYPPLDWAQSERIWEVNVKRLKDTKQQRNESIRVDEQSIQEYACSHYKNNVQKKRQWNGRQIRNAFQTAFALAEYEANEASLVPQLRVEHFMTVARASTEFDDYLYQTHGLTPSSLAEQQSLRKDAFKPSSGIE